MKKTILMSLLVVGTSLITQSSFAQENVVQIIKRNAQNFAIDGNNGAANGQSVYLWEENSRNINQQWVEINRGAGFYSYRKQGTNHCLDGGRGGANRQDVYLWECRDNNQNQHWQKVSTDNGFYQLRKRNALGFAIDGGSGGSNGQNVALYDSSNPSQNLQWQITVIQGGGNNNGGNNGGNNLPSGLHEDITRILDIPTSPRTPRAGYSDSYSVGDRCYCETNFDHDLGPIRVDTPVGNITVQEACDIIGPGPGSQGRPVYNDAQCGNGPPNTAIDEVQCPGRVDIGRDGCNQAGPLWNFN